MALSVSAKEESGVAQGKNVTTSRASRRSVLRSAGALALAVGLGVAPARMVAAQAMGEGVQVYPPSGTWTASPYTEISFRGLTADELGAVRAIGSVSGAHSGIMKPHGDGTGVSFVPDARFEPGEVVTVEPELMPDIAGDTYTFGVVRPVEIVPTEGRRTNDAPEAEPQAFRTRPDLLPPVFEISTPATGTADGYVFLGAKVPDGQHGLAILDNEGQMIWYDPQPIDTDGQFDFRVQEYLGEPVLTWAEASMARGYGFGHFVIADSSYERIVEFQSGNGYPGADVHELLLTPRGTALVMIYHGVEWDVSSIGGSRYAKVMDNIVQEVEIETGRVLFEWHSLDHVGVDESYQSLGTDDSRPYDYFHLNSIEEDADGNFLISARHTFAIYKIDRQTGEVTWRLNGKSSDFEMGDGTSFAWQHDARILPTGELTLFDNAESNQDLAETAWSRGLVLALDEEVMTATVVREYVHPTEILSTSQANMQVLPNGNVFIGWGSAPVFSELSPEGEVLFEGRFPAGGNSYRAYRFPWVGEPAEPPAVAVEHDGDGTMTVFASWNGATEVARWRVLAGPSPTDLIEVGSADRNGFETEIDVQTGAAYVAVEALDATGAIVGASGSIESGA
jgi:hypothetical protein